MANYLSGNINLTDNNSNYISGTTAANNKKNKTTKMMMILMGTYYAFFLPLVINSNIMYDPLLKLYVQKFLVIIFYFNAMVNPSIYGWMSPDFNLAFRTILRIKCSDRNSSRAASGSGNTDVTGISSA